MTAARGRGRAGATQHLIATMVEIAKGIQPCSVRALAYQLFNRKLIPSMAKNQTSKVSRLCVIAREEGALPWDWITDATRQEEQVNTWDNPADYAFSVQRTYRRNKWEAQPKHVSVWSEKSTIAGTLQPVLERYEVPFQVLHGWSGATPIMDAANANFCRTQATLILYVGDYDPSGMWMSEVDLPKRLARYSSDDPSDKDISIDEAREMLAGVGLEIRRIALTNHHTRMIGKTASFPASDKKGDDEKNGDSRYQWFVTNYGAYCWELDALSPNDLRECVEQAIIAELDFETWERYIEVERLEREAIVDTCKSWKSNFDPVSK
jgi:hypothetical protein